MNETEYFYPRAIADASFSTRILPIYDSVENSYVLISIGVILLDDNCRVFSHREMFYIDVQACFGLNYEDTIIANLLHSGDVGLLSAEELIWSRAHRCDSQSIVKSTVFQVLNDEPNRVLVPAMYRYVAPNLVKFLQNTQGLSPEQRKLSIECITNAEKSVYDLMMILHAYRTGGLSWAAKLMKKVPPDQPSPTYTYYHGYYVHNMKLDQSYSLRSCARELLGIDVPSLDELSLYDRLHLAADVYSELWHRIKEIHV